MRTRCRRRRSVGIAVLCLLFFASAGRTGEEEAPAPGGLPPFQGKLSVKDPKTGEEKPIRLLGGELGTKTAVGVEARLYVLQASSPERFRTPGAPTHVFTVALLKAGAGKPLDGAGVSLRITGQGGESKADLREYKGEFYQGKARLADAGRYTIQVRFKAGGKTGSVDFPFEVVPPPGSSPGPGGH